MSTDVVIIGGGFAGVATARQLERIGRKRGIRVTLVSRTNYLLFTPMLPEVAGGSIDPRDITEPLRACLRRTTIELAETRQVDIGKRTVTVESLLTGQRRELRFDHLVLALGSVVSDQGIAGVREHTVAVKTMGDAVVLHDRVLGALEEASSTHDLLQRDALLRFVIVGGGFTGVEVAGELLSFLKSVRRFYPALENSAISVQLLEAGERLLAHLPERFGKYAASALRARGVELRTGAKISSVDAGGLQLHGGSRVESRTIVWSAGVRPEPLVETLPARRSEHGAVVVNGDFSVPECPGVWALGDCAAIPKPDGGTYAPLAQNAVREGPVLARNIVASVRNRRTRDFRYKLLGQMASLGGRYGLAELPGDRMLTGRPAWMLWRTYYLSRLPGWYRKARVAADWTLEAIFPAGIPRLALTGNLHEDEERHATTR